MHLDGDQTHDQPPIGRRVTVKQAASELGISPEAVRARIKRGTLHKEKGADGTVYVRLDADRTHDRMGAHDAARVELVDELRDRIRYLEEESKRKDAILLRMAERIPELEASAPPEPREAPETNSEGAVGGDPSESVSKPSWWRRWFGA